MTTIIRLTANLPVSTIAAVADQAACDGISFDAALLEIINAGFNDQRISPAVGRLLNVAEWVHGSSALDAAVREVWRLLGRSPVGQVESEGGHAY